MKILGLVVALVLLSMLVWSPALGLIDLVGMAVGLTMGLLGGLFGLAVGLVGGVLGLVVGLTVGAAGLAVGLLVMAVPFLIVAGIAYGAFRLFATN